MLGAFARNVATIGPVDRSVETGTGRTTLLLSHLSDHHTVFAKDDAGDGDSLQRTQTCHLLRGENVEFVVGPTQRTLLAHDFAGPVDVAFLDGPHAYPFPDLEYWAVYPHIRAGGLLVIDDIQIPSIHNMYRVLASDAMWHELNVVDNAAFLQRTTSPAIDPYGEGWWMQGYNSSPTRTPLGRLREKVALRTRIRVLLGR